MSEEVTLKPLGREPETPEEVEAFLRAAGVDPEWAKARGWEAAFRGACAACAAKDVEPSPPRSRRPPMPEYKPLTKEEREEIQDSLREPGLLVKWIRRYEATVAALEARLAEAKAKNAEAPKVRCDTCAYWERLMQLLRGMGKASPSEYGFCYSEYTADLRTHEGERVCQFHRPINAAIDAARGEE